MFTGTYLTILHELCALLYAGLSGLETQLGHSEMHLLGTSCYCSNSTLQ